MGFVDAVLGPTRFPAIPLGPFAQATDNAVNWGLLRDGWQISRARVQIMADDEADTNGVALRCPVWVLTLKQHPSELFLGELADGGRLLYLFSDADLAVRYLAARNLQSEAQAAEVSTNAALSVLLKWSQQRGASLVAIDCRKLPSAAQATYPITALLQLLETPLPKETPVVGWHHLVHRRHPWRRQLYVKGRNMTARQLIGAMRANQLDEAATAADFHLPVEAVREALAYVAANQELLETEAEIERLMLRRGGVARGPQPVS